MTPEEHDLLVSLAQRQEQLAAQVAEMAREVMEAFSRLKTGIDQLAGMIMSADARVDRLAEAFARHSH